MTAGFLRVPIAGVLLMLVSVPQSKAQQNSATIEVQVVGDRTVFVQLPSGYSESTEAYPVLYALDGGETIVTVPPLVDSLVAAGSVPEMIIVAIPHKDRRHDLTPTSVERYPTSGGGASLLRFIADELVPHIDRTYQTQPVRVLHGHSLGGLFVAYAYAAQPGLFAGYIASSPTIHWDNWVVRDLTAQTFEQPDWETFFFMSVGSEDIQRYVQSTSEFADWLEANAPDRLRWRYHIYEGADHGSVGFIAFVEGLAAVFANLANER